MTFPKPEWKTNDQLPAGKGATVQQFFARVGDYELEIKVAPWGEGDLTVNGREISHVDNAKNWREAFGKLAQMAEQYLREHTNPKSGGAA